MSECTKYQKVLARFRFHHILLTILLLGISVVVFQAYRYREIMYGRFFKMFWRLTFLLSFLVYFILIIVSVINAL